MKHVVPLVVGKLGFVLKTGYVRSHAVSCIHAEPNDISTSHCTVEAMCFAVDKWQLEYGLELCSEAVAVS